MAKISRYGLSARESDSKMIGRKFQPLLLAIFLVISNSAIALDRGDYAYICYQRSVGGEVGNVVGLLSLGWLDLPRKSAACGVRIIDRSGNNYLVEKEDYNCGVGVLMDGREWTRYVYASRSACE